MKPEKPPSRSQRASASLICCQRSGGGGASRGTGAGWRRRRPARRFRRQAGALRRRPLRRAAQPASCAADPARRDRAGRFGDRRRWAGAGGAGAVRRARATHRKAAWAPWAHPRRPRTASIRRAFLPSPARRSGTRLRLAEIRNAGERRKRRDGNEHAAARRSARCVAAAARRDGRRPSRVGRRGALAPGAAHRRQVVRQVLHRQVAGALQRGAARRAQQRAGGADLPQIEQRMADFLIADRAFQTVVIASCPRLRRPCQCHNSRPGRCPQWPRDGRPQSSPTIDGVGPRHPSPDSRALERSDRERRPRAQVRHGGVRRPVERAVAPRGTSRRSPRSSA